MSGRWDPNIPLHEKCDRLQAENAALNHVLMCINAVLDGLDVSDFDTSNSLVRAVVDLRYQATSNLTNAALMASHVGRIEQLEAALRKAIDALRKYGAHSFGCVGGRLCSCGLNALLTEQEPG